MKINPESLARASSRHPWRVIGVWGVLFLVMVGVSSSLLSGVLTNDISFTNKPESIKAQDVIDQQFSTTEAGVSTEYVIVHSDSLTVDDPAYQVFVKQLQATLASKTDLVAGPPSTYYDALAQSPDAAAALVSKDKHYTLIPDRASRRMTRRRSRGSGTRSHRPPLMGSRCSSRVRPH